MPQPPVRTCVGCGRRAAKAELVRYVVRSGSLERDPTGSAAGRGAYTCPSAECLEQAVARKRFARSLRAAVAVPEALLRGAGEG
ncbi:MAG: YlxR family protein [Thermoleophilia bacterium]